MQFLENLEYLLKFNDKYLGNLDRKRKIYAPANPSIYCKLI